MTTPNDLTLAQIEEGLRLWRAASDQPLWAETSEARALQKVLPVLFPAVLTMAARTVEAERAEKNEHKQRMRAETERDEARRELRELKERIEAGLHDLAWNPARLIPASAFCDFLRGLTPTSTPTAHETSK